MHKIIFYFQKFYTVQGQFFELYLIH